MCAVLAACGDIGAAITARAPGSAGDVVTVALDPLAAEGCYERVPCPKCGAEIGAVCPSEPLCHSERVEAYAVKIKSEANQ